MSSHASALRSVKNLQIAPSLQIENWQETFVAAKHIPQVYKPCYMLQSILYSFDPHDLTSQLHMCVYQHSRLFRDVYDKFGEIWIYTTTHNLSPGPYHTNSFQQTTFIESIQCYISICYASGKDCIDKLQHEHCCVSMQQLAPTACILYVNVKHVTNNIPYHPNLLLS